MRLQAVAIEYIDLENFLRYGEAVEVRRPDPGRAQRGEDEYRTLARVPSNGWKIALHCVRARWTDCLYSFDGKRLLSPQRGVLLLCVAPPNRPQNVQLFVLDGPVALNAGIPHALLTLSAESWVQVSEDFESQSQPHKLRKALVPAGTWD
jgi:hypothetical protein